LNVPILAVGTIGTPPHTTLQPFHHKRRVVTDYLVRHLSTSTSKQKQHETHKYEIPIDPTNQGIP